MASSGSTPHKQIVLPVMSAERPSTPPSRPVARACPDAPRKWKRVDAVVDFSLEEAIAALSNPSPYIPIGFAGRVHVVENPWELCEDDEDDDEFDLTFVGGIIKTSAHRVPVLCPQGRSLACFSADVRCTIEHMRSCMVAALCGVSKPSIAFAVFVLGADHRTLERVVDTTCIIVDRRDVAAVFVIEDHGPPVR